MFEKLKKMKKNEEETTEEFYSEEGDFGEFENVKVKEEDKQEDATYYEEVTIEEKKKKRNKTFIIIMGILIVLLVVVLIIRGCVLKQGKLKAIEVQVPTIVYLGETTEITGVAQGSGALWQTAYNFDTTNAGVADLEAKGQLTGKKVTNEIIPITTGRFAVVTTAKLGSIELGTVERQVIVCRKLTKQSLTTENIIVEEKATNRINLDVGTEDECFSNLRYTIVDPSIATIDENGNITGIKAGTSVINITDGETEVKEIIEVKASEDLTKVKEIKIETTNITIKVGEEKSIKYTIEPATATNKNLIWTTNNQGVVTVSSKGVVKGIGVGTGVITVTTEDKSVSKLIIVKVEKKATTTQTPTKPTEPAKDTTAPKLTSVKIYSNNENKTKAKTGDTITVEVVSNEGLNTKPSIYIGDNSVVVTCGNGTTPTCKGSYKVLSSDKAGAVSLKIVGYKDKAGNTGSQVTTTTDKSSVAIYIPGWGEYTTTPCDTTDTENCKTTSGFLKQKCKGTTTTPSTPCSWQGSGGPTSNSNNCYYGTGESYYCRSTYNSNKDYWFGCYTGRPSGCNLDVLTYEGSCSLYYKNCSCVGGSSESTTCTGWINDELTTSCTAATNSIKCTAKTLYQVREK